jgi:branched-chain amino acid transport system ATP-binding protein
MTVLAVDDLFRSFGGIHAVDGVTFDVEQAEIVGIIGPNGSGKSTLFNLLTGALKPDAGTITLFGRNITGSPLPDRPGRPGAHLPDSLRCS